MISLLIFGLLAAAGVALLSFAVRAQGATAAKLDQVSAMNRLSSILTADLAQASIRQTRGLGGELLPVFTGESGANGSTMLRFVRDGWSNLDGTPRASEQKVEYGIVDGALVRIAYPMLDGAPAAAADRDARPCPTSGVALPHQRRVERSLDKHAAIPGPRRARTARAARQWRRDAAAVPRRHRLRKASRCRRPNDVAPSERGAALLTVLLLVAVIAVLAGTALEKLRLATRLGGNAVALDQARAYSFAAETLAVVKVTDLLLKAEDRVTLQGGWSGKPIPLPIPNGTASATVVDGGNCFNLNSLVSETGPGVYGSFTPARVQFARLIRLVDPAARSPDAIAAAASDWIDSDTDAIQDGAEDSAYGGGKQGYRTGNTLMSDPSELRAVAGVSRADYDKAPPVDLRLAQGRALQDQRQHDPARASPVAGHAAPEPLGRGGAARLAAPPAAGVQHAGRLLVAAGDHRGRARRTMRRGRPISRPCGSRFRSMSR